MIMTSSVFAYVLFFLCLHFAAFSRFFASLTFLLWSVSVEIVFLLLTSLFCFWTSDSLTLILGILICFCFDYIFWSATVDT